MDQLQRCVLLRPKKLSAEQNHLLLCGTISEILSQRLPAVWEAFLICSIKKTAF